MAVIAAEKPGFKVNEAQMAAEVERNCYGLLYQGERSVSLRKADRPPPGGIALHP